MHLLDNVHDLVIDCTCVALELTVVHSQSSHPFCRVHSPWSLCRPCTRRAGSTHPIMCSIYDTICIASTYGLPKLGALEGELRHLLPRTRLTIIMVFNFV